MYSVHVVTRLMGAGDALVRCMFRISLANPYFHSMSDCCWKISTFYFHQFPIVADVSTKSLTLYGPFSLFVSPSLIQNCLVMMTKSKLVRFYVPCLVSQTRFFFSEKCTKLRCPLGQICLRKGIFDVLSKPKTEYWQKWMNVSLKIH